jgi:hypothetical protein
VGFNRIPANTNLPVQEAYSDQEETEKDDKSISEINAQIEALNNSVRSAPQESEKADDEVAAINAENKEKEKDKRTRTVRKTVFFQGSAFIIEEEISIGSSEVTSVRTSEDSYEVNDNVKTQLMDHTVKNKKNIINNLLKEKIASKFKKEVKPATFAVSKEE